MLTAVVLARQVAWRNLYVNLKVQQRMVDVDSAQDQDLVMLQDLHELAQCRAALKM